MTRNAGTAERGLQIVLGTALPALQLMLEGGARWLGLVPLLTGIAGNCPACRLLSIRTCRLADQRA